jgi:hypothetical protein
MRSSFGNRVKGQASLPENPDIADESKKQRKIICVGYFFMLTVARLYSIEW